MNLGIIEINWSALMILINVIILSLIMKRFFFEKIHNFMQSRQDAVRGAIGEAEAVNRRADLKMEEYQKRIANVEAESRDIIRNAKIQADNRAKRIIGEANDQASQIISKAHVEIEKERNQAMSGMRDEVVSIALLAASKILEEELSENDKRKQIIDKVIEEAGASEWQS